MVKASESKSFLDEVIRTVENLVREKSILSKACEERLALIYRLQGICEERLNLINQLHNTNK
jgi:hypothetical protein